MKRIPAFWFFAIPYCLAWIVLCTVFQTTFRTDIIEQYALGDQWMLSSGKNPLLSAWILNVFRRITFDAPFAPYLAAESGVLLMLWCIWQLARAFLRDERRGEQLAFLAVLASANYRYLNIGNLIFANNLVLTVFWVVAIYCLYRALTENRAWAWAATGMALGLALQGKYTAILLVFSMLVFMFANAPARRYWFGPGPWLTVLAAFLVFLPHIAWAFSNDFHTFLYVGTKLDEIPLRLPDRFLLPWKFPVSLILVLLPSLITLIPLTGWCWQWKLRNKSEKTPDASSHEPRGTHGPDRVHDRSPAGCGTAGFRIAYLATMILVPIPLHMIAAASGIPHPTSYVMPLGMYATVLFLALVRLNTVPAAFRRTTVLGSAIAVGTMIVWASWITVSVHWGKKPPITEFPARALAAEVEREWKKRFGEQPCPYIMEWNHYYLSGYVHVYGSMRIPIYDSFITLHIDDGDLNRRGAILLWDPETFSRERSAPTSRRLEQKTLAAGKRKYSEEEIFECVRKHFPRAQRLNDTETELEIPYPQRRFAPYRVGMAVIPPVPSP
ncbi:MAG TPA: hypothetical protein DEB39_08215 [Planctomycetaceae bacterium]|nr:hypothetical protein [Planctomycetaceae bacterium]